VIAHICRSSVFLAAYIASKKDGARVHSELAAGSPSNNAGDRHCVLTGYCSRACLS
jgi:hypothetical protein